MFEPAQTVFCRVENLAFTARVEAIKPKSHEVTVSVLYNAQLWQGDRIKQGTILTVPWNCCTSSKGKPVISCRPHRRKQSPVTLILLGLYAVAVCASVAFYPDKGRDDIETVRLLDQQLMKCDDYEQRRSFALKAAGGEKYFHALEELYYKNGWDSQELVWDLNADRASFEHKINCRKPKE